MAEISQPATAKKSKGTVSKKRSTRVDLTPMVDLGFILITFFIFTTSLSELKAMALMAPNDKDPTIKDDICETCALTVILGENNMISYYEGLSEKAVFIPTTYDASGLRKLITDKKKSVIQKRHHDDFVLIIKPGIKSEFRNLIDAMDECAIGMVKKYYIDEITTEEEIKLKNISNLQVDQ